MPTTIEVILPLESGDATKDRVLTVLGDLGAEALELFDEQVPARIWAHFPGDDHARVGVKIEAALAPGVPDARVLARRARPIDLGAAWREGLRPIAHGPLWVVPRGQRPPPGAELALFIESEGAFGSGHHDTTALCLARIVELAPRGEVLDVGTGSGVLALAALRLGARTAVGTDVDPEALERARENAVANALAERFVTSTAMPDALGRRFSLVVANIIGSWLVELAPHLVAALDSGADLVLSGVRPSEADEIARIYRDLGLRALGRESTHDWVRLDFATSW